MVYFKIFLKIRQKNVKESIKIVTDRYLVKILSIYHPLMKPGSWQNNIWGKNVPVQACYFEDKIDRKDLKF